MTRFGQLLVAGLALIVAHSAARAHDGMQLSGGSTSGAQGTAQSFAPCQNGYAGIYPCRNVDLLSYLPIASIGGGSSLNDMWGWTDSSTGHEYALVGRDSGTGFVDVTDPQNPVYIGNLPSNSTTSPWRAIKEYGDFAFVASEAKFHGMQVFDLRRLRSATPSANFSADVTYSGFSNCHTLAINKDTGYAYAVGTNTCSGGLHMIDVHDPLHPKFAGCYSADGYTHETECVVYNGPDAAYDGHEICMASNEDTLTIVDVTDKAHPLMLSRTGYVGRGYTHQGWLTGDQSYFLLDDELDEMNFAHPTRTYVWNVTDLNAPFVVGTWDNTTLAIDHNQYILQFPYGEFTFQANYRAGLHVLRIDNPATAALHEVAYFDVYPSDDSPAFNGSWSNYPFFASGTVLIGGIEQGLFAVRPYLNEQTPTPTATSTNSPLPTSSPSQTLTPQPTGTPTLSATATQTPTSTETPLPTASFTPGPPGFGGQILYRLNNSEVNDVQVQLSGPVPSTSMTGIDGSFAINGLSSDTWQIVPTKTGGINGAVTAIDATLVLQSIVGLRSATTIEQLAGDVNGSGNLTAIDATLILQFVVGSLTRFPVAARCNSDFAFLPAAFSMPDQQVQAPSVGSSTCQPGGITFDPLSQFAYGQNFTAVAFGDVQATWKPPGGTCASCAGNAGRPSIHAGRAQRSRGSRVVVPLYLTGSDTPLAFDGELRFDATRMRFAGLRRSAALRGALVASHAAAPDRLRFAVASSMPIDAGGKAVLLAVFEAPNGVPGHSPVRVGLLPSR